MGQIVQRGVLVEDLENEQMDRFGGNDQSFLPGVVLLAAGGVDGLVVEEKAGASHVQPVTTAIAIECCGDKSMPFGPPTFPGCQKVGGPQRRSRIP